MSVNLRERPEFSVAFSCVLVEGHKTAEKS